MTGKRTIIIPANHKNPYTIRKSGRKIELISKVQSLHPLRPAA